MTHISNTTPTGEELLAEGLDLETVAESTLSDRLKFCRKTLHLTQGELANKSSVDQAQISRIESGKTADPSIATISALAESLQVPVTVLIDQTKFIEYFVSGLRNAVSLVDSHMYKIADLLDFVSLQFLYSATNEKLRADLANWMRCRPNVLIIGEHEDDLLVFARSFARFALKERDQIVVIDTTVEEGDPSYSKFISCRPNGSDGFVVGGVDRNYDDFDINPADCKPAYQRALDNARIATPHYLMTYGWRYGEVDPKDLESLSAASTGSDNEEFWEMQLADYKSTIDRKLSRDESLQAFQTAIHMKEVKKARTSFITTLAASSAEVGAILETIGAKTPEGESLDPDKTNCLQSLGDIDLIIRIGREQTSTTPLISNSFRTTQGVGRAIVKNVHQVARNASGENVILNPRIGLYARIRNEMLHMSPVCVGAFAALPCINNLEDPEDFYAEALDKGEVKNSDGSVCEEPRRVQFGGVSEDIHTNPLDDLAWAAQHEDPYAVEGLYGEDAFRIQ